MAEPASRVVSLIPAATEILFALGAGDRLVGRTRWGLHPAEAADIPDIGDGIRPSLEAIVARDPDLVIVFDGLDTEGLADRLAGLGVRTLPLRHNSLEDLERNVSLIGGAVGCAGSAASLNAGIRSQLSRVAAARPTGARVRVYYDVWIDPPMTIGRGSFLDSLITLAGGRNVFGDLAAPSPEVGLEAIVKRDPDLVLHPVSSSPTARPVAPGDRPGWRAIGAVSRGEVVTVDGDLLGRLGPRVGEAVAHLARAIAGRAPALEPIAPLGDCIP